MALKPEIPNNELPLLPPDRDAIKKQGDDRDKSYSAAKCRLGNNWSELAGKDFLYFMVFDKKAIDGAYTVDKAKELIKQL